MSSADSTNKELTKAELIADNRIHEKDTGSPEVQIALLTDRLKKISEHSKRFPNDKHSKRGLLRVVSERKSLLTYLHREDPSRYHKVLAKFGLRK